MRLAHIKLLSAFVSGAAVVVTLAAGHASATPQRQHPPQNVRVNPALPIPAGLGNNWCQNENVEPSIAVDPVNGKMIASAQDLSDQPVTNEAGCPDWIQVNRAGLYLSDSGRVWRERTYAGGHLCAAVIHTVPGFCERDWSADSDFVVAFGPRPASDRSFSSLNESRAYYVALYDDHGPNADPGAVTGVALARSDDDGNSWLPLSTVASDSAGYFNDKPTVWADRNRTSPCFGDVYVAVAQYEEFGFNELMSLFRSTDGGESWSGPVLISPPGGETGGFFSTALRSMPDGTLVAAWDFIDDTNYPAPPRGSIQTSSSRDCGASFGAVSTVRDLGDQTLQRRLFSGTSFRIHSNPALDADGRGGLVLSWPELDASTNRSVIEFSRSSDAGRTWSSPTRVSDPAAGNAFDSSIGVDPSGRDIIVSWANETASSSSPGAGVAYHGMLYAISHDGGATFSILPLSDTVGDPDGSTGLTGSDLFSPLRRQFVGDYNATAVAATDDGAAAYVVWSDSRNSSACTAVDAYRAAVAAGQHPTPPDPQRECPAGFGNTDIYVARVNLGSLGS